LEHAYGSAADVPALLRQLENFPPHHHYEDEPWFTLWSSLCHQGDVFSASFAAVPHLLRIATSSPDRADYNFFLLPTSIEIARRAQAEPCPVPNDLENAYLAAWRAIPALVAACATRDWDDTFCRAASAALCVAKGQESVAEALLELSPDVLPDFLEWLHQR
jgi:hypothetical protein